MFALAAAIAGAGGYLLAGWKGTIGKDDFSLLTGPLSGLPLLLLAVVGGVTVVSGALIGALLLVAMPQVAAGYPSLNNLMILLPGLVGISLARNPDGLVSDVRNAARVVQRTHCRDTTHGHETRRASAALADDSRAGRPARSGYSRRGPRARPRARLDRGGVRWRCLRLAGSRSASAGTTR